MIYPNPHPTDSPWFEYAEKWGAPNIKWCEETISSWISEPANCLTNIAFYIATAIILKIAKRAPQARLKSFAVMVFLMGFGSMLYHASNNYPTQIVDFIGMFLMVYWCMGANFIRLGWLKPQTHMLFIFSASTFTTLILHQMYIRGIMFQGLILTAGGLTLILEVILIRTKPTYRYLGFAILFLGSAFSLSISDGTRIFCIPDQHWIHGHALWHIACGFGMVFIAKFYAQFNLSQ